MPYPNAASPWPPGSTHHNPALQGVFIPEVWSVLLADKFYDGTVIQRIANNKWQEQAARGTDRIHIPRRPSITVHPHEVGLTLQFQRPSAGRVTLEIDKGLYFATILDDVLAIQSNYDLTSMWMEEAGWALKIAVDTAVLASMVPVLLGVNTGNTAGRVSSSYKLGAPGAPRIIVPQGEATAANHTGVMTLITSLACTLTEQNIPPDNRYLVVPTWLAGMLRRSDAFQSAEKMGDATSVFRSGLIGTVENVPVYESHLLPRATESGLGLAWYVFMGHQSALTFAWQINKMSFLPAQQTIGDILRGLFTYGSLVVTPEALAAAYVVSRDTAP